MSTFRPTVPLLVEDAVMSKTVVESSPGVYAINTLSGGAEVAQIAETVGEKTDSSSETTVIGLLKSIVNKLL